MRYERHIDLVQAGEIHLRTSAFSRAENRARAVIANALDRGQKPYVALSGGKDSVALLALVHSVAMERGRDFDLWAHVSDASFPGTVEVISACAELTGRRLILDESPVSAFDVIGQQSRQRFGKSGFFFDAVKRASESHDLVFTGVRAKESKRRSAGFRAHGHTFRTNVPAPILRCDAIAEFSIEDVAATLVKYRFPIHPIYSKMPIGDKPIRLGYATQLDLIEKGTVIFLRRNYPELFLKLCAAMPEARNYV